MKKYIFLTALFSLLLSIEAVAANPVMQLNSYIPTPSSKFQIIETDFLKFQPIPDTAFTEPCEIGVVALAFDTTTYEIRQCEDDGDFDSSGTWGNISSSHWAIDELNSVLYPKEMETSDTDYKIGIGTKTPSAELEISIDGTGWLYHATTLKLVEEQSDDSLWEFRAANKATGSDGDHHNFFSLYGGTPGGSGPVNLEERLFISTNGEVSILENGLAELPIDIPQKFNVQEYDSAINSNGDLVVIDNLGIVISNTGGEFGTGVGIGFGNSNTAPKNIGAAIIHERTGSNSNGSMHFATKDDGIDTADIPIRMTLTEFGDLGINALDPLARLEVRGDATTGSYVPELIVSVPDGKAEIQIRDESGSNTLGRLDFVDGNEGTSNPPWIEATMLVLTNGNIVFQMNDDIDPLSGVDGDPARNDIIFTEVGVDNGDAAILLGNAGSGEGNEWVPRSPDHLRIVKGVVDGVSGFPIEGGAYFASTSGGVGRTIVGVSSLSFDPSVTTLPIVTPILPNGSPIWPVVRVSNITNGAFIVDTADISSGIPVNVDIDFGFILIGSK